MLTSPLRPILRSPLSSPFERRGGGVVPEPTFDPLTAFGSDLVAYYGKSVHQLWTVQSGGGAVTLYQDNAGTTPVTATGQTVGRISDLSGNGAHLTQSDSAKRGTLTTDANGKFVISGGTYVTPSINLTGTDRITVFSAFRKTSDAAEQIVYESSTNYTLQNARFALRAPTGASGNNIGAGATASGAKLSTRTGVASPFTAVCVQRVDFRSGQPTTQVRVNGTDSTASTNGTVDYVGRNEPIQYGSRGGSSAQFTGDTYSFMSIVKRAATTDEVASMESFIGEDAGVFF